MVPGTCPLIRRILVIREDRVAQIVDRRNEAGSSQAPVGVPVLDCTGAVVAPGFIDVHTHSDLTWLYYPECTSRVTQGITTEVIGNCGMSPAPFASNDANFRQTIWVIDQEPARRFGWATYSGYLEVLSQHRAATNVVPFVGHGSARQMVLSRTGTDPADALAPSQVAEVVGLVREALQLGAWGLSFGLMYSPGEGASFAELMSVASEVRRQNAVLSVHMRSYEAANIQHAIEEMVRIQSGCGVALQLSHLRVLRPGLRCGRALPASCLIPPETRSMQASPMRPARPLCSSSLPPQTAVAEWQPCWLGCPAIARTMPGVSLTAAIHRTRSSSFVPRPLKTPPRSGGPWAHSLTEAAWTGPTWPSTSCSARTVTSTWLCSAPKWWNRSSYCSMRR